MKSRILEIESLSDNLAAKASDYRYKKVIPALRLYNRTVKVIRAGEASKTPITGPKEDTIVVGAGRQVVNEVNELAKQDFGYIVAVAHGAENCVDFEGASLFVIGDYPRFTVEGRIVHLVACNTAEKLGPDMVRKGCTCFFGYKNTFTYGDTAKERRVVLECDAEIDRRLALGALAGEVERAVMQKYADAIEDNKTKNPSLAELLRNNSDALVCEGDRTKGIDTSHAAEVPRR